MRSRKSPEKLRLPHPTERERATLRPKDDDDDTWLWVGLSGSPIASNPRRPDAPERSCWSCAAPPLDAHAADATETDFLLAAAPPLAYGVVESVWWGYEEEEEEL
jgi:hypothetical protein